MKSTKIQTVGTQFDGNIVTSGLKAPLHALGEQTGKKIELYQTNVKSQVFIYRT